MRKLLTYHPTIGYTFIPNLQARVRHEGGGYLIRTNAQGFRSDHDFHESSAQEPILLFGDSFTAADGVSNRYRYSEILEGQLKVNLGLVIYCGKDFYCHLFKNTTDNPRDADGNDP